MQAKTILQILLAGVLCVCSIAQGPVQTEKLEPLDIFLTSYKGPPLQDVASYHQGQAGQQFAQELRSDDDERFCLKTAEFRETSGLWKGKAEPSWWIHVQGSQRDAEAYAASHAVKHDQESALIFVTDPGGLDAQYILTLPPTVPLLATLKALREGGFQGATLAKNRLILVDPKREHVNSAKEVAEAVGATLSITRGRMRLIMQAEYEHVLEKYKTLPSSCSIAER
jgi:hypothetical protein